MPIKLVPNLPDPDYFGESTMIRLYKGDYKKYLYPSVRNRRYQIVIEARYRHKRTGKAFHFGRSSGRNARSDYCCSFAYTKFDYFKQLDEAIEYGFGRAAAGDEYAAGDSGEYTENEWASWKLVKVYAVYLIIWRTLKKTKTGKRRTVEPVVLVEKKKKKLTEAELEKKYPTPKKYLEAQNKLRRKIKSQETRAFKRKKSK